jgi:hypothetical protein
MADEAAFTAGTTSFTPSGGFFQTTATNNALTTGQAGAWQMTANRAGFINLRNAAGTEIGTSGAPVRVDPTGTTTQPVSLASTTITGTVAATQSGTWTVQPGNTANTTAWLVTGTGGTFPVTGTVTANQGSPPWSVTQSGTGWTVSSTTNPTNSMNSTTANSGLNCALAATFDDVAPTAITENNFGFVRMSTNRNLYGTIRDAAGNERGVNVTAGNALTVDGSATTQPVSIAAAVTVAQSTAANLNATVTGTVAATQSGAWTVNPTTSGNWGLAASTQNVASPTNAQLVMGEFNTAPTAITSGNSSPLQLDTNGNLLVKLNAAGTATPVTLTSTTITGTVGVTQSSPPWNMQGDIASGTADSGNPVKVGGIAAVGNPTNVTSGNRVGAQYDRGGKQVVIGALRNVKGVQKTSITVATETTVATAGGSGIFNDIYAIVVTNKSATAVFVDFRDATAGTVRMTLAAPAGDTRGFTVAVDSAMVQAVANNNWTATVSSAVTSIEISMLYVQNV